MKSKWILVILALNIILCLIIVLLGLYINKLVTHSNFCNIELASTKGKMSAYFNELVSINSNEVYNFLSGNNLMDNIFKSTNHPETSIILIPPQGCDACIERELSIIQKKGKENILLIVPDIRYKDLSAMFATKKHINILYYSDFNIGTLNKITGIIYCKYQNGIFYDIYIKTILDSRSLEEINK